MRIIINSRKFNLEEGDEVEIQNYSCGRCGCDHTIYEVARGDKIIARFGEYVRLVEGREEIFGDVAEKGV